MLPQRLVEASASSRRCRIGHRGDPMPGRPWMAPGGSGASIRAASVAVRRALPVSWCGGPGPVKRSISQLVSQAVKWSGMGPQWAGTQLLGRSKVHVSRG